uniref:ER membrane protein complex subunit 4 n=1 Tax=Ciona intestinalis TaxID=7719 RepID=A0A1W2W8Q4_CIOIN|nr:ER membrane protein complex subunit 4 [Ciona intestinalis]XP_009858023.1 ER membrane protein complex subunit 4 [Ciona intestinalis]|eukprot:XP_002126648.1 ER membrane protein complex subunit 4 [Ciona intestinalis]
MHPTTNTPKRSRNKWSLDVNLKKGESRLELPAPPGYAREQPSIGSDDAVASDDGGTNLIDKKSWEIAVGPIKGLPMNIFIMYMAGNTISIFPIMMVGMMFFRPTQALMGIRTTMRMLENSSQYIFQTFLYFLGNCLALALAVYKCNSMGLLPTHASDWLAFAAPIQQLEYVAGGFAL